MKKLFACTLTIAWLFATMAPPVVSAASTTTVPNVPSAEICSADSSMICEEDRTVTTVTINSDGDVIVTSQTCEFEDVGYDPLPGGGVNPYCDYGNCGKVYLTPV